MGTTAPAGVGDLVAPKIEADPEAGFPRVGGPPKTGADPKADEVLVDPPKIEAEIKSRLSIGIFCKSVPTSFGMKTSKSHEIRILKVFLPKISSNQREICTA